MLAFLRGPLRYAERLVGHDAALRALTRWRVWLYDCLTPRVPAALAGWRSGDLLSRAIDDVDALQDLYLRTVLPVAVAVGAGVLGVVLVGVILPWEALGLGAPLAVALTVPAALTWRRSGDDEMAELAGALSAQVVDALSGAPELLAFGADEGVLGSVAELAGRAEALERRHARLATTSALLVQACVAVALAVTLALGTAAVHAHRVGAVMVAVLPLAVLATFDTVPGVPAGRGARAGGARLGRAPLRTRRGAGAGARPRRAGRVGAGGAVGRLRRGDLALCRRAAAGARRGHRAPAGRRAAGGDGVERGRQVEPRQRAAALLAARGRFAGAGRDGRDAAPRPRPPAQHARWRTSAPSSSRARCATT